MAKKPQEAMQNVVRVAETNLDGTKPVRAAIRSIKGISFMLANAISMKFDRPDAKLAELDDESIKRLESLITEPQKHGIPSWLLNRRKDPVTGKDFHITASTLDFTKSMDINEMKKKKSYRGVRHILNLPVRGQRTRGSFRKGKTVGVSKKKKG